MKKKNKNGSDAQVQLPPEQSEMYELAARLCFDDKSARILIEIVNRIAYAKEFTERDRMASDVAHGAFLMTSSCTGAIEKFCQTVSPFPAPQPPDLRLVTTTP